ncbi:hypothetical protein DFH09DRAFT_1086317 [Mycena vulgaris]|nr:hypothetical protein DFH09DRAFT_1086317 [Mycena vulgaris]
MSLSVAGVPVLSLMYADAPRTVLSSSFASQLPSLHSGTHLFTSTAGVHGPVSFLLTPAVSISSVHDVVLGLDWAGYLRDSLLHSGMRLGYGFGSWYCFSSYPLHVPVIAYPTAPPFDLVGLNPYATSGLYAPVPYFVSVPLGPDPSYFSGVVHTPGGHFAPTGLRAGRPCSFDRVYTLILWLLKLKLKLKLNLKPDLNL